MDREKTGEELELSDLSGSDLPDLPVRDGRGRFRAGVSGNPRGRPRGSRDARTVALAQLLSSEGETIVSRLVDAAKRGRPWAVRLAFERLVPKLERKLEFDIVAMRTAAEVRDAMETVILCAASGKISTEDARAFGQLIEQQRKAIETSELAVRLDLLEQQSEPEFAPQRFPRPRVTIGPDDVED